MRYHAGTTPYDLEPMPVCEDCGTVQNVFHVPGYYDFCDECLVRNAEACGDWDEPSTAAAKRLLKRQND